DKALKVVAETTYAVISELNGEVIRASALDELMIRAAFPHRKAKALERAVASALRATSTTKATVHTSNPFAIKRPGRVQSQSRFSFMSRMFDLIARGKVHTDCARM